MTDDFIVDATVAAIIDEMGEHMRGFIAELVPKGAVISPQLVEHELGRYAVDLRAQVSEVLAERRAGKFATEREWAAAWTRKLQAAFSVFTAIMSAEVYAAFHRGVAEEN